MSINGKVADGYEAVGEVFERNFADELEVGAAVCVFRDGVRVVDLWAGHCDQEGRRPWTEDTLVNVYSTTKGLAAIAFATLVEDGLCSYEDPVREYWPELLAGADGLSIGDLLAHRGGLCGLEVPLEVSDLYDWKKMIRLLEQQQPLWPPGSASGYHAVTWGYLPGELVLRLTGETLGARLQHRVCGPSGGDFFLGLPEKEMTRVAPLIGPNRARVRQPPGSAAGPASAKEIEPLFPLALQNPLIRPYHDASSAPWQQAEIAASNGHGSARGIAQVYAAVIDNQSPLLSGTTRAAMLAERVGLEKDLVLGHPIRRGAGVILNTGNMFGPGARAWGHSGAGGSTAFADPETGLAFAYVMNQMRDDEANGTRASRLIAACYECV